MDTLSIVLLLAIFSVSHCQSSESNHMVATFVPGSCFANSYVGATKYKVSSVYECIHHCIHRDVIDGGVQVLVNQQDPSKLDCECMGSIYGVAAIGRPQCTHYGFARPEGTSSSGSSGVEPPPNWSFYCPGSSHLHTARHEKYCYFLSTSTNRMDNGSFAENICSGTETSVVNMSTTSESIIKEYVTSKLVGEPDSDYWVGHPPLGSPTACKTVNNSGDVVTHDPCPNGNHRVICRQDLCHYPGGTSYEAGFYGSTYLVVGEQLFCYNVTNHTTELLSYACGTVDPSIVRLAKLERNETFTWLKEFILMHSYTDVSFWIANAAAAPQMASFVPETAGQTCVYLSITDFYSNFSSGSLHATSDGTCTSETRGRICQYEVSLAGGDDSASSMSSGTTTVGTTGSSVIEKIGCTRSTLNARMDARQINGVCYFITSSAGVATSAPSRCSAEHFGAVLPIMTDQSFYNDVVAYIGNVSAHIYLNGSWRGSVGPQPLSTSYTSLHGNAIILDGGGSADYVAMSNTGAVHRLDSPSTPTYSLCSMHLCAGGNPYDKFNNVFKRDPPASEASYECVHIHPTPMTATSAGGSCNSAYSGGTILSIYDQTEYNSIRTLLSASNEFNTPFWINGSYPFGMTGTLMSINITSSTSPPEEAMKNETNSCQPPGSCSLRTLCTISPS